MNCMLPDNRRPLHLSQPDEPQRRAAMPTKPVYFWVLLYCFASFRARSPLIPSTSSETLFTCSKSSNIQFSSDRTRGSADLVSSSATSTPVRHTPLVCKSLKTFWCHEKPGRRLPILTTQSTFLRNIDGIQPLLPPNTWAASGHAHHLSTKKTLYPRRKLHLCLIFFRIQRAELFPSRGPLIKEISPLLVLIIQTDRGNHSHSKP